LNQERGDKKMKKIIFTLLIVLTFVVPSASYAGDWTGPGNITSIRAGVGNNILLTGTWPTYDPRGCGYTEGIWELVITDDVGGKNRAALIMSAFMAGKKVNLSAYAGCSGTRPQTNYFVVDY
jgi:hypothetical protein